MVMAMLFGVSGVSAAVYLVLAERLGVVGRSG